VNVFVPTGLAPPLDFIDTPSPGSTVSGIITVSGWAVDSANGTPIGSVQVKVDGAFVGLAAYGGPRPDVCTFYPGRPSCPNVGYTFQLNTASWTSGAHTITVVATDTDGVPDSGSVSVNVVK